MDFEPSSISNESEYKKNVVGTRKKSVTTILAVISLILSATLIVALGKTVSFFKDETARLSEEYEKKLALLKDNGSQNQIDVTQGDLNQAQIIIDESSFALSTVVSAVRPSVVCVCVTVPSQTIDYGFTQYQTEAATSTGSGIIWTSDGYIITNQHVVETAQQYASAYITVLFDDGTETEGTLIAADKQTDLALIKVETTNPLSQATIGSSADLMVGQTAIAIGNPLGLEYANSVTVGIVSGLNRQVTGENGVSTMIQTDAAVNPGNSGGALVDASGKVIGVVSAKISSTEVEGIGFAIPIDDAIKIVSGLKEFGYVKDRPATGIAAGTEITASMSRRYRLPQGLYVTEITAGSAAEAAGIKKYDVILSFDGKTVTTLNEIEALKKEHKVGDTVSLRYYQYRTGKTIETTLTLTEDKG
ncbi:MAG: trypsin-like peptidase domain-containing protein [Clostridia bacterium]|nr:trypsin-like peptidase domain-containing protein [Clostridia bacterium]